MIGVLSALLYDRYEQPSPGIAVNRPLVLNLQNCNLNWTVNLASTSALSLIAIRGTYFANTTFVSNTATSSQTTIYVVKPLNLPVNLPTTFDCHVC
jgi:hypothetical protein